jgi:uncharacterized membrane protein
LRCVSQTRIEKEIEKQLEVMLQQGEKNLLNRGELVLGSVSLGLGLGLGLGGYLSWQGITGLALR